MAPFSLEGDHFRSLSSFLCWADLLRAQEVAPAFLPGRGADAEALLRASCSRCDARAALAALRSGADRNCVDEDGRTPLQAILAGVTRGQVSLASHRALALVLVADGGTPIEKAARPLLSAAAAGCDCRVARFLVGLGADVNQQDPERGSSTPLMLALASSCQPALILEMCEELVDLGADGSAQRDADGRSAADILKESVGRSRSWRRIQEFMLRCT
mmetsp:Transcript_116515/g.371849  ORF Transcript_116515/g.371849 Transcript_116515/m.371849 type:complete len:217 (-) Transcript_116515:85-735(-)